MTRISPTLISGRRFDLCLEYRDHYLSFNGFTECEWLIIGLEIHREIIKRKS